MNHQRKQSFGTFRDVMPDNVRNYLSPAEKRRVEEKRRDIERRIARGAKLTVIGKAW